MVPHGCLTYDAQNSKLIDSSVVILTSPKICASQMSQFAQFARIRLICSSIYQTAKAAQRFRNANIFQSFQIAQSAQSSQTARFDLCPSYGHPDAWRWVNENRHFK